MRKLLEGLTPLILFSSFQLAEAQQKDSRLSFEARLEEMRARVAQRALAAERLQEMSFSSSSVVPVGKSGMEPLPLTSSAVLDNQPEVDDFRRHLLGPGRRRYGLRQNGEFDEREHPEKSTRAAARYLKALYEQFGNWALALAAYNAGENRIERLVRATGIADFWELARKGLLPPETRRYVPAVLAVIALVGSLQQRKYVVRTRQGYYAPRMLAQ